MQITRQRLFQAGTILIFVLLGLLFFIIGKGHTLLLDNKTVTLDGTEYAALALVEVSIDSSEPIELTRRMRDMVQVPGQRHTITVSFIDKTGNEVTLSKKFSIKVLQDMYLLSIPAFIEGAENWITPFTPE